MIAIRRDPANRYALACSPAGLTPEAPARVRLLRRFDVERVAAVAGRGSLLPFAGLAARTHGICNWAQHIVWLWRELPVPVVAAVHGVAFGGGFQLALGADLRYVAPGTLLSIVETKWGVVPDMAGTQLMRHLARKDVVRELTYTARIFSADEALAYGFATRLVEDPRAAAMSTARDIAARSPDAEATEQQRLIGRPNQIEAVKANLENRLSSFANA